MYSTDQFRVFSDAPEDHLLSRARRLLQEGRVEDSERAYQAVLATHPDLKQAWVEHFALLRHSQRHHEALELSDRAVERFGDDPVAAALKGAALVELGRFRDGLEALDHAAQLDPDLGLVWHEAGYAAFRLGELSRALMALDRAFALEPHGSTLHLRGRVLRQAGRYLAAEVAFEGAAQAAEFPAQRLAAEQEVSRTRRYAAFAGSRPDTLPESRRWFAETGAVPLSAAAGPAATDLAIVAGLAELARDAGWRFTALLVVEGWSGWYELAERLKVPVSNGLPRDTSEVPLIALKSPGIAGGAELTALPAELGRGLSFVLQQGEDGATADVCGCLAQARGSLDPAFAIEATRHPEGRLRDRILQ